MTACDDCFQEFAHPIVHELMDKNERFREKYGNHARWDWDDIAVTLTFSDPVLPTLRIDVSVVGSTEGDSWQWSWANPNYETRSKIGIDKVREFGEVNGYEQLTSGFLDANEYTGWKMTAITAHLLDAPGAYRFPTDVGYCYLIYRHIEVLGADQNEDPDHAESSSAAQNAEH
ncbi:MAG: DUF6882 domain-containing protein [Terracidiphilus sp.]